MSEDEKNTYAEANSDTNVVVSSKSRFKGDAANKEKAGKPKRIILPVTINKFPADLYDRMVAFMKKHAMVGGFGEFCMQLIENQFFTEESMDLAVDARKAKQKPEAKPDNGNPAT